MRHRNATPRNQRQQEARDRALATVARMRRESLSLSAAAKIEGTQPGTVRRYAGSALTQKTLRGPYVARVRDRIARQLNFLSTRGTIAVTVRDSKTATKIGEYMNAIKKYVRTGNDAQLQPFKSLRLRSAGETHEFVTDPAILRRLADADVLPEGLYRAAQGVS